MAMFSTLTVVVDDTHLTFRFTFGLIRKHIALADIRHYQTVRNPWHYGWGIHLYPGGVLYNVSGFQAVEIVLKGGAGRACASEQTSLAWCAAPSRE
jgi:hypothetical protein